MDCLAFLQSWYLQCTSVGQLSTNPKENVPVTEKEGQVNPRKEIRQHIELQNIRLEDLFKKA